MDKIIFEFGELVQEITATTNKLIDKIVEYVKKALEGQEDKRLRFTYPIDVATKCPIKSLWIDDEGKVMFTDEEFMDSNFEEADITANEAQEIALDLTAERYIIEDKD